jgi:hypothetical protein
MTPDQILQDIHDLFITTDTVDQSVAEHAATFYEKTSGTEIALLALRQAAESGE